MPRTLGQALGFLLGFWLALVLIQPLGTARAAGLEGGADVETALLQAVNALRVEHGLVALERDSALDAVARAHSADMATRRYFSHESPEGLSPPDRMARAGVDGFSLAGENIGTTSRGGDPNQEIVRAWLTSPAHRDNLLAPVFNTTGVGITRASDGTWYYTQLYATRPR